MPPGRLVSASMVKLIGHNGVSISVRPFFALGAPTGCTDLFGNCPEDVATAVVLKTLLSPSVGVYSSFTLQQKKFAFIEIHSWVAFSTCSIFSVVDSRRSDGLPFHIDDLLFISSDDCLCNIA